MNRNRFKQKTSSRIGKVNLHITTSRNTNGVKENAGPSEEHEILRHEPANASTSTVSSKDSPHSTNASVFAAPHPSPKIKSSPAKRRLAATENVAASA